MSIPSSMSSPNAPTTRGERLLLHMRGEPRRSAHFVLYSAVMISIFIPLIILTGHISSGYDHSS